MEIRGTIAFLAAVFACKIPALEYRAKNASRPAPGGLCRLPALESHARHQSNPREERYPPDGGPHTVNQFILSPMPALESIGGHYDPHGVRGGGSASYLQNNGNIASRLHSAWNLYIHLQQSRDLPL
jgi:hypothetical protein